MFGIAGLFQSQLVYWLAVSALPLEVKVLIPEPSKLFSTEAAAPKLFQRLNKFYELKHLDEKADWHFLVWQYA